MKILHQNTQNIFVFFNIFGKVGVPRASFLIVYICKYIFGGTGAFLYFRAQILNLCMALW